MTSAIRFRIITATVSTLGTWAQVASEAAIKIKDRINFFIMILLIIISESVAF
jgi:hypothetical protein